MDATFTIRQASYAKDLDIIFNLVNDNNGKDIFLNSARLGIDKNSLEVKQFVEQAWVYEVENTVVACVSVGPYQGKDPDMKGAKLVKALTVHPDYQRQGIGSRLMDFIENLGGSITFGVYEPHGRVLSFYKKRGYPVLKSKLVATFRSPDQLIDPDVKVVIFRKDFNS